MDPSKSQQQTITCLAMSPSEEVLVCSTSASQLYSFTLSSTDLGRVVYLAVIQLLFSFYRAMLAQSAVMRQ